jgi:hypothetical protein
MPPGGPVSVAVMMSTVEQIVHLRQREIDNG